MTSLPGIVGHDYYKTSKQLYDVTVSSTAGTPLVIPSGWVLSSIGDVWPPTLETFVGCMNPDFSPDFVFILTVCHSLAVLKFMMFLCQILNSSYILEAVS